MKDKRTIEELLGLYLTGYSSRQVSESNGKDLQEDKALLAKARQILKRQNDARVITLSRHDPDYPARLLRIGPDAPPLVHLSGNRDLLHAGKCVAIVGTRYADRSGLNAAYRLAQQFASDGYVIVSGLALGCDTAAHRGCLDAGGKTIAIVASGLNITHPKVNKALQNEIIQTGGAILSEHPFGVKANPTRLVARCRLQAAFSQTLIVAQCPIISGTMYAVRFAREYSGCIEGWEQQIYAVDYDRQNELNSGNKFLLDYSLAMPIRPGGR